MYVCVCNALKEADIHQAINGGATKCANIPKPWMSPQCGKCACDMQTLIETLPLENDEQDLCDMQLAL